MPPLTKHKKWAKYSQVGDFYVDINKFNSLCHAQASGCLEWQAAKHKQGYGMFGVIRVANQKRMMSTTHRIAARLKLNRPLESSEQVLHTCHNPACCNPDHLVIASLQPIETRVIKNAKVFI